jgi:hypothetical protein
MGITWMATVQRVRFLLDCFERGEVRFARGRDYPVCPTALTEVRNGHAEIVTIEMDAKQHGAETRAAHEAWNAQNAGTIASDPDLRSDPNPAAKLVERRLAELQR